MVGNHSGDGQHSETTILSVDSRPVRDIGGAIGQSIDKAALEELGLLDENGELPESVDARQTITDDGTVTIDIPTAGD